MLNVFGHWLLRTCAVPRAVRRDGPSPVCGRRLAGGRARLCARHTFSKIPSIVPWHSNCTRALTFQNMWHTYILKSTLYSALTQGSDRALWLSRICGIHTFSKVPSIVPWHSTDTRTTTFQNMDTFWKVYRAFTSIVPHIVRILARWLLRICGRCPLCEHPAHPCICI